MDTTEPLGTGDPADDWVRQNHPERIAMREAAHEFVPITNDVHAAHRCTVRCICDACWQPGAAKVHRAQAPETA
jgi:hypothetical protein